MSESVFLERLKATSTAMWKSRGVLTRHWLLSTLFFLLCAGSTYFFFHLLGFPPEVQLALSSIAGLESFGLIWFVAAIHAGMVQQLNWTRWDHERMRLRGVLALPGCVLGLLVYAYIAFYQPDALWLRTTVVFSIQLLFLFGVYELLVSFLLEREIAGELAGGFVERWAGRIAALAGLSIGLPALLLLNFVGGMYWWSTNYITPERKAQVIQRSKELRSLQAKSIYDQKGRYLGLLKKTESDWSERYNDPKLLQWKVSRTVMLAEGMVRQPAWWWRYLPDGRDLQCEPFSIEAFLRVPYYFIKQRRKVGGSTPALQAAKNFIDFGQSRARGSLIKTIGVKLFEEMPRSYIMCKSFTPREMMAVYMATLWAGYSANYGIHRMSLYYFNQPDPSLLSWNQSVLIAASLPNPGHLNPWYIKSCRLGRCKNKRQQRVYAVWKKRVRQIKARLRRELGVKVSDRLPVFRNGIHQLRVASYAWLKHDLHLRGWLFHELPKLDEMWQQGSSLELNYDRYLTLGAPASRRKALPKSDKTPKPRKATKKPPPQSLLGVVKDYLDGYRTQLSDLQISYTLFNTKNGRIVSQYGGDEHFDMAMAKKPVVGSVFKVLTLSVAGGYWPDALPLINRGRTKKHYNRRRFRYQVSKAQEGHAVRNSHSMPPYVYKKSALAMSANIAFVFLSLRWTWFVDKEKWWEILQVGLTHMLQYRKRLSPQESDRMARYYMARPKKLKAMLIKDMGYQPYFINAKSKAIFEAAKAHTIRTLLKKRANRRELTRFLSEDSLHGLGFSNTIKRYYYGYRTKFAKKFEGPVTLDEVSWLKDFRMEMGLRYLIVMAGRIAGYDTKENHLKPVMTMTLGVHNSDTKQLASLAGLVAAQRPLSLRLVRTIRRDDQLRYFDTRDSTQPTLELPEGSLKKAWDAMNAVIRWGTASYAGRQIARRYGWGILRKSGAKTGTVQNTRGVSCIGFMENRAGAVTLSTPDNDKLVNYSIRKHYTVRLKRYEKYRDHWQAQMKAELDPLSSKARWARRQFERYKTYAENQKQRIEAIEARAKTFYRMRKTWKVTLRKAQRMKILSNTAYRRARLAQRQIAVYERFAQGEKKMLRLYNKWFQRYHNNKRNAGKPKSKRYLYYTDRKANNQKRLQLWQRKKAKEMGVVQEKSRQAAKHMKEHYKLTAQAKREEAHYDRMRAKVSYTHKRWSLNSSKACQILFSLLSFWKDKDEKRVFRWPTYVKPRPRPTPRQNAKKEENEKRPSPPNTRKQPTSRDSTP